MPLLEQNDEWLVGRRYLSQTSMTLVLAQPRRPTPRRPTQRRPPELAGSHNRADIHTVITSYTTRCDLTATSWAIQSSDSTAGSASATPKAAGTANAATAESKTTS